MYSVRRYKYICPGFYFYKNKKIILRKQFKKKIFSNIYMEIIAEYIDDKHIGYFCPICKDRYKKDGTPYKNAKPIMHRHGSNGDVSNRTETRFSHCLKRPTAVEIKITDETKRR